MSQTTEKRSSLSRVGRWVAELVLVFVGVYAAFWLNNYQQHRQDAERRVVRVRVLDRVHDEIAQIID